MTHAKTARAVIAVLIIALSVLPSTTVTASERILTPEEMDVEYVRLFNENKLDELGQFYYAENALFMPPNQEPIRGKQEIVERLKELRQVYGQFQTGLRPLQVVETERMASVVGNFAFLNGGIRIVSHETFQRQVDGSWKAIVDMPGFRDPQR
jgi:ketosteroid isomerase-like protein